MKSTYKYFSYLNIMNQDWHTVTIRRPVTKKSIKEEREKLLKVPNANREVVQKKHLNENNHTNVPRSVREENGEVPKMNYVSNAMSQIIRKTRLEKKYTQEDLAKLCNLDKNIISDIENPIKQTVYNAQHINKIAKALGITIPRK